MDTVLAQAVIAATDDVLAFAELSADFFGDFRVQSQAEDCILINLALTHLCARPLPSSRADAHRSDTTGFIGRAR